MPRLTALDPQTAHGKTRELLEAVRVKFGLIPNLTRTFAQSPAALEGFLSFLGALEKGVLSPQLREQIAIAVADANQCQYCLSAHTALGRMAGLTPAELHDARLGLSRDPKTEAVLGLARAIVEQRGLISDQQFDRARRAGVTDAEIAEVVANAALNIFTNYFNHVAQTELDFAAVPLEHKRSA